MVVEKNIGFLESILSNWQPILRDEYPGYHNHVYRMVNFCFALSPLSDEAKKKVMIAAAFHDVGIWIDNTLDYIPPSVTPAMQYLLDNGLADWSQEIRLMIEEHHKLTTYSDAAYPLVEQFRKADLVDFSLGLVTFGLPRSYIAEVKSQIPNSGFHKCLVRRASQWVLKHPLNPAPIFKW